MLPTLLNEGVECISVPDSPEGCIKDDAIDDVDIDRAGLAGLAGANVDGEAGKAPEDGCFAIGGAVALTGVAFGVDCSEDTVVLIFDVVGWALVGVGPW